MTHTPIKLKLKIHHLKKRVNRAIIFRLWRAIYSSCSSCRRCSRCRCRGSRSTRCRCCSCW